MSEAKGDATDPTTEDFLGFAQAKGAEGKSDHGLILALDEEILRYARLAVPRSFSIREFLRMQGPEGEPAQGVHRRIQQRLQALRALRQIIEGAATSSVHDILNMYPREELLLHPTPVGAYVMSIDIRQSTELMLNAPPNLFAIFISAVTRDLVTAVKEHGGIVDKFTGDGLLAYFPCIVNGKESLIRFGMRGGGDEESPGAHIARTGERVLAAAKSCHERFKTIYEEHGERFSVMLVDVGLGIGIDYGTVVMASVNGLQTTIGKPVVYACRLSSGPVNSTYLNVGARSHLDGKVVLHRTKATLKHKGAAWVWTPNLPRHGLGERSGDDQNPT